MAEDDTPFDKLRPEVDSAVLRLFRSYAPRESLWLLVGVLAGFLSIASGLVPSLLLGITIDAVFVRASTYSLPFVPQAWIPTDPYSQFLLSVALMLAASMFAAGLARIRGMSLSIFGQRVMHAIRTDAHRKMQQLDMSFFDSKQTGEVMSVVNNDVNSLGGFLQQGLASTIQMAVVLVAVASVLFYLNWQLTLVTLTTVPIAALFTVWFVRRIGPVFDRVRSSIARFNTRLETSLSGIEIIKTHGSEDHEQRKTSDASWNLFGVKWDLFHLSNVYQPLLTVLSGFAFVATFAVGGIWVSQGPPGPFTGRLSLGSYIVFVFLTQRFVNPLRRLGSVVSSWKSADASAKRVFGLMDIPVKVQDRHDAIPLRDVRGLLEYEDVVYSYDEGTPVLEDVSFVADPGESIGIVGPTGAGKSTLVKLMLRLYDPDEGYVRLDGRDLRDVTLASLRRNIGYVSQDPFLFDGTIAENIRYGRFGASEERVRWAAEVAAADSFIEKLPDGYDTRVGERGVKLSGGQRQRICIARAILQDPALLILDEATSEVDTETEMLIKRSLDRIAEDRTTVMIAHRLSTIRDADKILVLEDGGIAERGSHRELLEADGLYANLWKVQAGEIEDLPEDFVLRAVQRTARSEAPEAVTPESSR